MHYTGSDYVCDVVDYEVHSNDMFSTLCVLI
jgi:hypothetical protein